MQVRVNNVPRKPAPTASAPIVPVLAELLNYGRPLPAPKDGGGGGGGGGTNDEAAAEAAKRQEALKRQIRAQQKGLRKKSRTIEQLRAGLQALNEEKLALTRTALQHDLRAAVLQRELSATTKRLEEKEAELQESKAMQAEAVRVKEENEALVQEARVLEEQVREATRNAVEAQQRLVEEGTRVGELQRQLDALRTEQEEQSRVYDTERDQLFDEKKQALLEITSLKLFNEQAEARAIEADRKSAEAEEQAGELRRGNEQLKAENAGSKISGAALRNKNAQQLARIKELTEELERTTKLVQTQQERLAKAEYEVQAANAAKREAEAAMQARATAATAAASSARQQSVQLERALGATSAEFNLRLGSLQLDRDQINSMYHEEVQLRITKERECKEAQKQSEAAWQRVRAVEAQLQAKVEEHDRLEYELATVRAELEAEEQKTQRIGARVGREDQELRRLRAMLRNSEVQTQSAEEANAELHQLQQRQAQNFEARLARVEEEKVELKEEIARLQQAHTDAPAEDSGTESGADDVDMEESQMGALANRGLPPPAEEVPEE
jgi:chromosome segregation ATPase